MRMTKLLSTIAIVSLMGGSTLLAASPTYLVGDVSDDNTWGGTLALDNVTGGDGDRNTALGKAAGRAIVDGTDNTFIGWFSGRNIGVNSTGNTFLGAATNPSGDINGSVFIGYAAGTGTVRSNTLAIANSGTAYPLIYGEFDNDMLRVNGTLDVNGTAFTKDMIVNGSLHVYGTVVTPLVVDSTIENNDTITSKVNADDISSFRRLLVLDVNNTGEGNSNVGFSLINSEEGEEFEWTFRTYAADKGFSASKIGTGGNEFLVSNTSTNPDDGYEDVVVEMGGVVVFENGHLVDGAGVPLASLVQEQNIKLAAQDKLLSETMAETKAMKIEAKAKDAEIIAMKAENTAMKAKQQEQALKIAQLQTMQQKVAMMESILTNLALNSSDTDKSKLSINLK